jgi:hypothetical protein
MTKYSPIDLETQTVKIGSTIAMTEYYLTAAPEDPEQARATLTLHTLNLDIRLMTIACTVAMTQYKIGSSSRRSIAGPNYAHPSHAQPGY